MSLARRVVKTQPLTTQSASYVKDSLHFVQPTTKFKLVQAANARQDNVFQRLHHDCASERSLEDNVPRWHQKC